MHNVCYSLVIEKSVGKRKRERKLTKYEGKFKTKEGELKSVMYVSVQVGEGSSCSDKRINGS